MPDFTATMRVTHIETWSVTAANEEEARKRIADMHDEVETDETGGETVGWEIQSIKKS